MPANLAESLREKADAANAPYTMEYVVKFMNQCAERGGYESGFASKRLTPELRRALAVENFGLEDKGDTTWVSWAAGAAINAAISVGEQS